MSSQTSQPLLSICIPTYNRAACLRQCLDSIVEQFPNSDIAELVEIVVSDNGSTDGTWEVILEFAGKFNNIFPRRNAGNLGFDRNTLLTVAAARAEFCWLLGDDDALFPGSIAYILPFLEGKKFSYFLANGWGYDKQLAKKALNHPNFTIEKNIEYRSLADFVRSITDYKDLVGNFGGMSSQIFARTIWTELPDKDLFVGTQVVHLHTLLRAFKNLPFCLISRPLVKNRSDNMRWEISPGLETLNKRQQQTQKTLVWILEEYKIPYSTLGLKFNYYKNFSQDWAITTAKKKLFKSQRSRDVLKKILGKL